MKNNQMRPMTMVMMLLAFVLLTGGCLQKPDEQPKPPAKNTNTPQAQPTPEPEVTSGGLYTNKEYGFTLAYPKEWAGVRMVEVFGENTNSDCPRIVVSNNNERVSMEQSLDLIP